MLSVSRADFGDDFTFGVATAAFQIEGSRKLGGPCIWDTFSYKPGNVAGGYPGDVICDHYNRWEEDLDLIRDGGFDAYRFSFAWARMFPEGVGKPLDIGVDFYDRLIDGMLERGIKPFATLYHWDLPSALQDKGGWMNRDIANWFADYAVFIQQKFGDRLEAIATLNEPWCITFLSHYQGIHAPGYRDKRAAARSMHHTMLAHGTAIKAMRDNGGKNLGIVVNLEQAQPASGKPEDIKAAELWDGIFNGWFAGGFLEGKYPQNVVDWLGEHLPKDYENDMATIRQPLDWLGINYYFRTIWQHDPDGGDFPIKAIPGPLEKTEMGWEIYPEGLEYFLLRFGKMAPGLPIYITENGMAEVKGLDDPRRVAFYDSHLKALLRAKAQGVDVRGYFAWSLYDNFEWAVGYDKRFGLIEMDYQTLERKPRTSYRAFQGMLHNG